MGQTDKQKNMVITLFPKDFGGGRVLQLDFVILSFSVCQSIIKKTAVSQKHKKKLN